MLSLTIKSRQDFISIGKARIDFHSPTILLLAKKTPEKYLKHPVTGKINSFCRIGYTVTKQIGNSPSRNKIKRRYREAWKSLYPQYALNHFDYVIIARREVNKSSFKKIFDDLKFCLQGIERKLSKQSGNSRQTI